jgi:SAM-dependent methyltransferase
MSTSEDLRATVMKQAQGAMALDVAFVGVVNRLFEALSAAAASSSELATRSRLDAGYVERWCQAAYAFGYLDDQGGRWQLTELGQAFLPSAVGSLMPVAIGAVLGAHMAERAAGFMPTGERPGESVLAERQTILPWFGPMLEVTFGALFEREILPAVSAYRDLEARGGVALDLGCGNGWYLRKLAQRFPHVRGVGLDGFEENVRQATERARAEGLADRLSFVTGDIYGYAAAEPVDLVAMNRALHHVWDQKERVFSILRSALRPGGVAVIWEPAWPREIGALREPRRRPMAFQNLGEHVQGNHFLRPEEIEAAFRDAGMRASTQLFVEGTEAIVVGERVD